MEILAYSAQLPPAEQSDAVSTISANIRNILTEIYWKTDRLSMAKAEAERNIELSHAQGNQFGEAKALMNLGVIIGQEGNNTEALELYQRALVIFEKIGIKADIARTIGNIGNGYAAVSNYGAALDFHHRALEMFEELGMKSEAAQTVGNIGIVHYHRSENERALEYYLRAYGLYQELGLKRDSAKVLGNIGIVYSLLSDYTHAFEYSHKAVALFEECGLRSDKAKTIANIGIMCAAVADYSRALEYYKIALAECEELGLDYDASRIISSIGIIYHSLDDFERGLEYCTKALVKFQELGMKADAAKALGNIGVMYYNSGDYQQALEYYSGARAVYEELGMKLDVAKVSGNIGRLYVKNKEFDCALEQFYVTLDLYRTLGNKLGEFMMLGTIGELFSYSEFEGYDSEKAENLLCEAINGLAELGVKSIEFENRKILSELYERQERWQDFAREFKKFHELKEIVQNEEMKKQVERFAIEREVAMSQREQKILRTKNAELGVLNAALAEKNEHLLQLNNEKIELLGIAAHDLKNPLTGLMLESELIYRNFNKMPQAEILQRIRHIGTVVMYMRTIVADLLDVNAIESGQLSVKISPVAIEDMMSSTLQTYRDRALAKGINVEYFHHNVALVSADQKLLEQVLENLISNAIKYSPKGKSVVITIQRKERA